MQNTQTLIDLGFERYPDWDFKEIKGDNYRKEINGKIFRAYEAPKNGLPFVVLGEVSKSDGRVKRWMDCCSDGSVERKIKSIK